MLDDYSLWFLKSLGMICWWNHGWTFTFSLSLLMSSAIDFENNSLHIVKPSFAYMRKISHALIVCCFSTPLSCVRLKKKCANWRRTRWYEWSLKNKRPRLRSSCLAARQKLSTFGRTSYRGTTKWKDSGIVKRSLWKRCKGMLCTCWGCNEHKSSGEEHNSLTGCLYELKVQMDANNWTEDFTILHNAAPNIQWKIKWILIQM